MFSRALATACLRISAADDHDFDQAALSGGLGLKFRDEGIVEAEAPIKEASQGVEPLGGFTVEDDDLGE